MKTLYVNNVGPVVQYEKGVFYVEDLNPEFKTKWRMSRLDMLRFAWRCALTTLW